MKPAMKVLLFCIAFVILSIVAIYQYNKPINVEIGELSIVQNGSHTAYVVDFWHGKHCEKRAFRSQEDMNNTISEMKSNPRIILSFKDLTENAK